MPTRRSRVRPPLPAPNLIVIKSLIITKIFQNYLENKDIRIFKNSFFYYLLFRIVRSFLANDIIIKIYNFKVYGSIKKNITSYFLLKKCEFGDYDEINTINKFSENNKIFFVDCGCNYGFYSFYVASISKKNFVLSIEASKKTSAYFLRNNEINKFNNIEFFNKAVSKKDNEEMKFNESENDWESSLSHSEFTSSKVEKVKTVKLDTLLESYNLKGFSLFIKLDIEGHEVQAIQGALKIIEKYSPIIIIEFSKFIFNKKENFEYLKLFLTKYDYEIYDTKKNRKKLSEIVEEISMLKKRHKTIGNYFLCNKLLNNIKL